MPSLGVREDRPRPGGSSVQGAPTQEIWARDPGRLKEGEALQAGVRLRPSWTQPERVREKGPEQQEGKRERKAKIAGRQERVEPPRAQR